MKSMKSMMMGGAILLGLTMCLTSCEGTLDDIFGEWSRPTHGTSDGTKPDSQGNLTSISIAPTTLELAAGETGQLTATVDPSGTAVTWSSDKEEVATVDANGLVTAVAAGIATITAKAGDKTATCEVTVTANPAATPLTMEAITAGTIKVTSPKSGMQYSLNGGAKTAVTTDAITVAVGDKVAFYGKGTSITCYGSTDPSNCTKIAGGTAEVKVYGNIMSLLDETGFATATTQLATKVTFYELFSGNDKLKDANGLLLPAETLTEYCYSRMFSGCTALTAAPALPAKTLTANCYSLMFSGCTALTAAPALPAKKLEVYCYANMFEDCTSLTTAPELPATTVPACCYQTMFKGCTSLTTAPKLSATAVGSSSCWSMFQGCTSLTTAPELKATTLDESCYRCMFYGCTSLTTAPELPATTLAESCYQSMFEGCKKLTAAPELKAETLAEYCCSYMFYGCKALTAAPELKVETLAKSCYFDMFHGCTSLTTAPALPAKTLANDCYNSMFYGCTSLETAPKLPAETLAKECYYYMFYNCTALTTAYVKAAYTTANDECYKMFEECTATGAKLHTTAANKDGWTGKIGTNWSVDNNWTD